MDDPQRFLPLSPHQFHILLALTDRDRHGYALIQDIAQRTDGALRLGTGTLYTAIARLVELGRLRMPDSHPARKTRGAATTACCRSDAQCCGLKRRDWALVRHARRMGGPTVAPRREAIVAASAHRQNRRAVHRWLLVLVPRAVPWYREEISRRSRRRRQRRRHAAGRLCACCWSGRSKISRPRVSPTGRRVSSCPGPRVLARRRALPPTSGWTCRTGCSPGDRSGVVRHFSQRRS
jgi:hypothetical protein